MKGNFRCDEASKKLFMSVIGSQYEASGYTLIWEDTGEFGDVDLLCTAYTEDGYVTYAFELKERRGKYNSLYYGKPEDNEGWIYEDGKDYSLMDAYHNGGYTPVYVNLYPDGVIRCWSILQPLNRVLAEEKQYHRHTVDDEGGTYRKRKVTLFNADASAEYYNDGGRWRRREKR